MKKYQVVGIGNAIVDVLSQTDDSFLDLMGIEKGIMQLTTRERGETLYAAMQERQQEPGGSVGNTLAGLGFSPNAARGEIADSGQIRRYVVDGDPLTLAQQGDQGAVQGVHALTDLGHRLAGFRRGARIDRDAIRQRRAPAHSRPARRSSLPSCRRIRAVRPFP